MRLFAVTQDLRALALDQLKIGSAWHLLRKELTVGLLNGALWGTLVGLFAMVVYHSAPLGLVMTSAVLLNLLNAAIVGVLVPLGLSQAGRDPAQGSSSGVTSTPCRTVTSLLRLPRIHRCPTRPRSRRN